MKQAKGAVMDKATTGLAGAWVASPLWWDWLYQASQVATMLAPILSVAWLGLKLVRFVSDWRGGRKSHE